MRHLLSKAILAATLIAGPAAVWGEGPAASPTTQADRRDHDRAQAVLAKPAMELTELRKQIQELTGLIDVTPAGIRQIILALQEQREALELDGAGAEGRRQALEEAVATLSKQLKERAKDDPVAISLEKVVAVRQAQLQRVQQLYKQAAASSSDVEVAEANLAQAQAEVAAAQQKAAGGSGGESLDVWNRQLLELGIADREREARLKFINKRLEQFSSAMPFVEQMEQ